MSNNYFWTIVIFLGIGTQLIRLSAIIFSNKFNISDRVKEIFSFIPAAILPALAFPMSYYFKGSNDLLLYKERLIVLILGTLIAYYSKNIFITITSGLFILYFLTNF